MADTKELRGEAPADLVRALDALALSHDLTRHAYCLMVLEKHVKAEMHRHSLIVAMMRGNPMLPDADGASGKS